LRRTSVQRDQLEARASGAVQCRESDAVSIRSCLQFADLRIGRAFHGRRSEFDVDFRARDLRAAADRGEVALTETVDTPAFTSPEEEIDEADEALSMTELLEQLGRELGVLALAEAQLETSRNAPEVKRGVSAVVVAVGAVIAFLTALACLNVAVGSGLSTVVPTWLASLFLAVAWLVVGGSLLLIFAARARRWRLWSVFAHSSTEAVVDLEQARNEAGRAVRATLERLGPAIAVELASEAVAAAGDIAEGVVGMGDDLLDASDEIVEAIASEIPAGGVVNQIWDVALMPGRFGLRVATIVFRRDSPAG
jgi:Putative Actinobacterial Holin-X, holin superfamily III